MIKYSITKRLAQNMCYEVMFFSGEIKKKDCRDPGLNQGPSDLQSDALPTELSRLIHSAAIHLNNKTMFRHINKVHRV